MDDWAARFADMVAASLKAFEGAMAEEEIAMFAVDCSPWNGGLWLAMLTQAEVDEDPALLNPAEMAAWKHYDFSSDFDTWNPVKELKDEMGEAYREAENPAVTAAGYFRACASALATPHVENALARYSLGAEFRLSVANPDTDDEFCLRT